MAIRQENEQLFLQVHAIHRRELLFHLLNRPLTLQNPTLVELVAKTINHAYALADQEKAVLLPAEEVLITTVTREIMDAVVLVGKVNCLEALQILQTVFTKVCGYILERRGLPSRAPLSEVVTQSSHR